MAPAIDERLLNRKRILDRSRPGGADVNSRMNVGPSVQLGAVEVCEHQQALLSLLNAPSNARCAAGMPLIPLATEEPVCRLSPGEIDSYGGEQGAGGTF